MGHGFLYQKDWEQLILEDQARDYAQYLNRKHYPKGMIIFLLLMAGLGMLRHLSGGIDSSMENLEKRESSKYRGYVVPINQHVKPLDVLTPCTLTMLPLSCSPDKKEVIPLIEEKQDVPRLLPNPFKELEEELADNLWMSQEEMDSLEFSISIPCWEEEPREKGNRIIDFEMPQPTNFQEVFGNFQFPQWKIARDAGICGTVIFRIFVNTSGQYTAHELIHSVHPLLSAPLEERIDKLRFSPAMQAGNPVPAWVSIPFRICSI
ncbi:MAG: energy transducer TonB [Bacteroidota bacterium]